MKKNKVGKKHRIGKRYASPSVKSHGRTSLRKTKSAGLCCIVDRFIGAGEA